MLNNVVALRRLKSRDWEFLEAKIVGIFGGMTRKDGSPMHLHSLDVGRRVKSDQRADDIAVVAAYCHDVLEDTTLTKADLLSLVKATLDGRNLPINILADSETCVNLIETVSYTEAEYELPKVERKAAATKRWSKSKDIRVLLIKKADIESNKSDAHKVSKQFESEYMSWAGPLYNKIEKRLAG